jgi:hypothetical protein
VSFTLSPSRHITFFSSEFKRKNEFRRICETLRLHQQQSYTRSTSHAAAAIAAAVGGSNAASAAPQVDPVTRIVDTRNYQLKVAIELGLWSVAFQTVDEVYTLLSKKRPSPSQMVSYYSNLANILWMSSSSQQHQLFHAACLLKYFAISSNISTQEPLLGRIADSAILAVLCTSVADSLVATSAPIETTTTDADGTQTVVDMTAEKSARLTTLTGSGGVPTTQSLLSDIIARDLISVCSEPVRKIHLALSSGESRDIAKLIQSLDGDLSKYAPGLCRVALVKAVKGMQSMYSCLKFEKFETMTVDILPLNESIRLLGQLKRTDQIDVSVDYQSRTISFGSSPSASSGLGMIECAVESLRMAAARVRAAARSDRVIGLANEVLFDEEAFAARVERERQKCTDRRLATDARKDAIEQDTIRRANQLAEQLQRAEEERLEADARARAAEQSRKEYEAKKRQDMLVRAKGLVERMVQLGGPIAQEVSSLSDDQLADLGLAKLEAMQKDQFAKERQERISKRRNESKRIEYTARLVRMAENEKITEWSQTVYKNDKEFFAKIIAEKADEWKKAAETRKASIDALLPFSDLLSGWKNKQMDDFAHKLAIKAEERRQQMLAKQAAGSDPSGSPQASEVESNVAPTSTISREEFKEMAKSLPTWRNDASATSSRAEE